jgi:hypothetical protein
MTDDAFVISMFPQGLRTHLRGTADEATLAHVPEVRRIFQADPPPAFLGYVNSAHLLRSLYPLVQFAAQIAAAEMQNEGVRIDMTLLPSVSSLVKHMRPNVFTGRWTDGELVIESRGTLPGGSTSVAVPALLSYALPGIQSTQLAARRSQSVSNLQQIGLAMHNYHDVHHAFPAAYSVGENGKPLLSWRVHILPFVGHEELYDRFRLDEPWSSKHNRQLIRLMPNVYRALLSNSDPGKTNYLAVAGKEGVFVAPEPNDNAVHPTGVGMAEISDGTSDTIAVVEACDQMAVIWTKPDDFVPDTDNPARGLVGLYNRVFHALFCDGHIRTLDEGIDKQTLRALFTRNGSESIPRY